MVSEYRPVAPSEPNTSSVPLTLLAMKTQSGGPSIDARMSKTRLAMPAADQELLNLRAQARRQPLQRRIIRSVASSTAIETRQPISSIEANLMASERVVINRRLITLA